MRILVVDDEPLNRFLLQHMLEEEGYCEVEEAEDGEGALAIAKTFMPDIVLLDIIMPGVSGLDTAIALKADAGNLYLPIIFITALDDQEVLSEALASGDDFVSKPFDRVVLAAKIRAHQRTRELSIQADEQNQALTYYQNQVMREHHIVEHIFSNALQLDPELLKLVDVYVSPASKFNGDMCLIERGPGGNLYFLMGDFTGHGLASAVGALPIARAFQTMAGKGLSISEMAETFNSILLGLLPDDMFFACAIVEISSSGRMLSVWNGGMPHLILLNEDGKLTKRFESQHMALGILEEHEFESHIERYECQYGARLFSYSDGVIESCNQEQVMLADEGLEAWLEAEPTISISELSDKVNQYRGDVEQLDDITMACFTCQPLPEFSGSAEYPLLPWEITMTLTAADIKAGDPVQDIMSMLTTQPGLAMIHSNLFTVLSELFNNALDHGLLEMNSELKLGSEGFIQYFTERDKRFEAMSEGHIKITLMYSPGDTEIKLTVQDSGKGFDSSEVFSQAESEYAFGRGLVLIKELSQKVEYRDGGTLAEVTFKLP